MNPPTNESVVMRVLSHALMGAAAEVGRVRWALHGHLSDEMYARLEKLALEAYTLAVGAENEAGRLEYKATISPEPASTPPAPEPEERCRSCSNGYYYEEDGTPHLCAACGGTGLAPKGDK